ILIAISIVILLYTKLYVLAALTIPLLSYFFYQKISIKHLKLSFGLSLFTIALLLGFIWLIDDKYNPFNIIVEKQLEFIRHIQLYPTNSNFEIPHLSNWISIIKYTPNAWVNTFIRPYLWECK